MLKKIFLPLNLIMALGIASSSAFAAEGAYVSAGIGHATFIDTPSAENNGYYQTSLDTRSTAFRVAFGYSKDMNPDFGLGGELGYNNYGSQDYESVIGHDYYMQSASLKYQYSAIDLLGKLTWHASKSFDVYGKLGIANEMVKVSGDIDVDNNHKVLPEMGLGISYFATEKLALDLAVYRTQGDSLDFNYDDDNALPSIFTVLFSVSYYLG